jgi:hypothetical protein
LYHFTISQQQTHPAVLRGSKKSNMCMKAPSTTTLGFPTLSPLLTAGKNTVGYFLDRTCIEVPLYYSYKNAFEVFEKQIAQ